MFVVHENGQCEKKRWSIHKPRTKKQKKNIVLNDLINDGIISEYRLKVKQ